MPSPRDNQLNEIIFRPAARSPRFSGDGQGAGYPGGRSRWRRRYFSELPEWPVRPVNGDLSLSRDLIEMRSWSYEVRHWSRIIAQNLFQTEQGEIGSWFVKPTLPDGTGVSKEVLAIARDLQYRYSGKVPVIGAQRLERAVVDMLTTGDSYLQLAFDKEGIGRNDYCISGSMFMPSLSMFNEEVDNQLQGYWQRERMEPSSEDVFFPSIKMLNFQFEPRAVYGQAATLQMAEFWRDLKEAASDMAEAAHSTAIIPWIHIMPDGKTEQYKAEYREAYEDQLDQGIIANLYLLHGSDVRKATNTNPTLKPLMDNFMRLRYQMVMPEFPIWNFPGLALEQGSSKELGGAPAMSYARLIASLRSIVGEQIRFAVWIEMVLRKGQDFWQENKHFEIGWPEWKVSELLEMNKGGQVVETTEDRAMQRASEIVNAPLYHEERTPDLPESMLLLSQLHESRNPAARDIEEELRGIIHG